MTITNNRYATNDSDLRELNENGQNVVDKIGTITTDDTILKELRGIKTNTSGGGGSVTVINTETSQVNTKVTAFELSKEIIRPANTTAYAINDIINADAVTLLPYFDFSVLGSLANRKIQLNSITIMSNNGSVATKLNCMVHLFNSDTITGQSVLDNTIFNPSYDEMKLKRNSGFDSSFTMQTHGSGYYMLYQTELVRVSQLDINSRLYFAIIALNAYVPTSLEKINISIKGYIL